MATTLLKNGTVIDGTGADAIADGGVLIRDGKIAAVGRLADITVPDGTEEIDVQGGHIMPGLIDTHVHMMVQGMNTDEHLTRPFSYNFYRAIGFFRNTIECGITSVRDAGGTDIGVKQAVEDGIIFGPRIQVSTGVMGITGGHGDSWHLSGITVPLFPEYPGLPDGICDGVEGVRKKVREILRAGAEVVKVCSTGGVLSPTDHPEFTQFSIEELQVIVQEAEFRRGLKVMAHAQGSEGIKNAIKAGIHSIEHAMYIDDEVIELGLAAGTYFVPTLLAPLSVIEQAAATGAMPEYGLRKARETIDAHRESIARAYKAGLKIAMGTDAGVMPHGTNLRELGLMADVGMSPMDVLVATTKTAAECMGWEDRVGTLETGKLADVTVSSVDPLTRIHDLADVNNIALVLKGGEIAIDRRAPAA
ncbi:MAG TPA: amidohydrolase family protein [Thermomicrobiales bacterium]|nr:amidohydrolase family protein [Thermomicrobiales bacterium]